MKIQDLKRIIAAVLCLICGFTLTGCALIFDWLNFYSTKLPTTKSEVDPDLKNPYPRTKNAITKEEFNALLQNTLSEMDGSFDESIIYSQNKEEGYINLQYVNQPEEDKPYGYIEFNDSINSFYLYDDGFYTSSYQYGTKYLYEPNYIDEFGFLPYEIIKKGSVIIKILNLLKDGLLSIDSDYENGKIVYTVDAEFTTSDLKQIIPFDLDIDEFIRSQIILGIDKNHEKDNETAKEIISNISIRLDTKDSFITLYFLANSFGKKQIDNEPFFNTTTSVYSYYVLKLLNEYTSGLNWDNKGYKHGKYEFYNMDNTLRYTLYSTPQTFTHTEVNDAKGMSSTMSATQTVLTTVLNDGTQLHYIRSPFSTGVTVTMYKISPDGSIQTIDTSSEDFDNYSLYFYDNPLVTYFHFEFVEKVDNQLFFRNEYSYDNIKTVEDYSFTFDKDLNILTGFSFYIVDYAYEYTDHEKQNPISIEYRTYIKYTITYDATITVPVQLLHTESIVNF